MGNLKFGFVAGTEVLVDGKLVAIEKIDGVVASTIKTVKAVKVTFVGGLVVNLSESELAIGSMGGHPNIASEQLQLGTGVMCLDGTKIVVENVEVIEIKEQPLYHIVDRKRQIVPIGASGILFRDLSAVNVANKINN